MDLTDVPQSAREGNVGKLFDETATHHGNGQAMEHHDERTTHAELEAWTAEFAGGLHDLGLEPDDRLLLFLPNCPEYLVASLGSFKAGVVISPVNPQYKRREVSYQLEDTDAKAVVTHPALRPVVDQALEETGRDIAVITVESQYMDRDPEDIFFEDVRGAPTLVERADDDVALLPYTSGTTGKPKGAQLTHQNTRSQLNWTLAASSDDVEPENVRSLTWLPLYHITGFTHTALQPLVGGGSLYFRSALEWDAQECMQLIEAEGITHFVGVTTMYSDMVAADDFGEYDLSSLESAAEGGAKLSTAVQEQFEETAGVDISEGYGLTETHGATHTQSGSSFGLRHGTIGQPLRITDCKIVDSAGEEVASGEEGELLVRGPQVMKGYHNLPDATDAAFTENGYFRTGDIARRDGLNYYEIVDRKKHMINTAGYNVYPSELENLLLEHEAVADAAVVGIPDERRNEVPKAFVVPADGFEAGEDVTAEEIKEYCLERVASYKHPREVELVEDLPRTTSGKIQKYKLEE
ncbi:class I adenylate-forming enzyme family protein [Natronorubrum daqingense]|uniref:AMP-dependent synthetase n=1 Tax=Natronorubrum daqingense TaxID=588898 RepID=A0A1N6Y616_9EURY|nr:AMP-binding protein [Natronorubrum daqingense]APX95767.1 AMP-dependent synthetase [Natronorubrum daqingense]SIR10020.1 long-chain acyl-CoA synthetase [Natronorubrum daqingense]